MSSEDNIAKRWEVLCGKENWKELLEPFLDSDLRRYLIYLGTMNAPTGDAFIDESASPHLGYSRYAMKNLLAKTGAVNGNPFKYEVTSYFYATSGISSPADPKLHETNWIGYVAVATDEGKAYLGRRDILVVWRGTIRNSEKLSDILFCLVEAPLIFGQNSENPPMVHMGWYDMYTTIKPDLLNGKSARDKVREEVARLVELYKDEKVSITVTGHSLGASLGTLNAVDLAVNPIINTNKKDDIPITAFLFASPKVGDKNFEDVFSKNSNLRALRISDVNDFVPKLPIDENYVHVGVGFAIDTKQSDCLKPELPGFRTHDLMLYMHGIDGFQGSHGAFKPHGDFDIAKINKYLDGLKDGYHIPNNWFQVKDKGMVQQKDGTYILDDYEGDILV